MTQESSGWVEDFLHQISAVRRLSVHTVAAYRRDLQKLQIAADTTALNALTVADIRRCLAGDIKAHPASLARRLAAWRTFFDYLIENEIATNNPARPVLPPKRPRRLPKSLTPDEVAAFLAPSSDDDFFSRRDRAIAEVFYSSAIRLSELAQLNTEDINLSEGVVYVTRGKGGRGRVAPLGRYAIQALENWLPARKDLLANQIQPALFIGRTKTRLTTRAIQQRIRLAADRQGLARPLSPHMLRHSCASHFLQSSGDLRATQELLGHRNITATQIYTRLDFQHLAAVYDRAHPRAQMSTKTVAPKTKRKKS